MSRFRAKRGTDNNGNGKLKWIFHYVTTLVILSVLNFIYELYFLNLDEEIYGLRTQSLKVLSIPTFGPSCRLSYQSGCCSYSEK